MAISIKSPLRKKRDFYRQLRWCEPWFQEAIDRLKKERGETNRENGNQKLYFSHSPPRPARTFLPRSHPASTTKNEWYGMTDSNRRHTRCKRVALPTELIPHGPLGRADFNQKPGGRSSDLRACVSLNSVISFARHAFALHGRRTRHSRRDGQPGCGGGKLKP